MYFKSERIVCMQRMMLGEVKHEVTSRRIGNGWNVRVFTNGEVNQELRVFCQADIRLAARDMLRMEDKCGNWSDFAIASRHSYRKD